MLSAQRDGYPSPGEPHASLSNHDVHLRILAFHLAATFDPLRRLALRRLRDGGVVTTASIIGSLAFGLLCGLACAFPWFLSALRSQRVGRDRCDRPDPLAEHIQAIRRETDEIRAETEELRRQRDALLAERGAR
jgi:hypothetical protein